MKRHLVVVAAALASSAFAAAPTRDATGVAGGLEERVARLERMLESRNQVQVEMQQQISELETEAGQLRGMLELQNHQIEQILSRQRDIYQDIDRRLGQGVSLNSPTNTALPQSAVPVATTPVVSRDDVAANDAYDAAKGLIQSKRYDEAASAFAKFVKEFPNSTYVANAYYWQAQLFYRVSDLTGARNAFLTVVNQYPKSNKRAESIFKLGLVAEKQGDMTQAKARFKQVVTEYPSSNVARMAKAKL